MWGSFCVPPCLAKPPVIPCRTGRIWEMLQCGCVPPWLTDPRGVSPKPVVCPQSPALPGCQESQGVSEREVLAGLSRWCLGCCQVSHLLSFPMHGHSSSCPSCCASPVPLLGLCCLLGFLLLKDLLGFTVHLPMELLTCLLPGITASSWPPHAPSSSGSGNGKNH